MSNKEVLSGIISDLSCEAGILINPANITYFTGLTFPFFYKQEEVKVALLIKDEKVTVIIPEEWKGIVLEQNFSGEICTYNYTNSFSKSILTVIEQVLEKNKKTIHKLALDKKSFSLHEIENIENIMNKQNIIDMSSKIERQRIIKTEDEIKKIKKAVFQSDMGIIGALNHFEGSFLENGYTVAEFAERVRVHVYESGGTGNGIVQVNSDELQNWFVKNTGRIKENTFLKIIVTNSYYGYWSNIVRTVFMGEIDSNSQKYWDENIHLKRFAEGLLKPAAKFSELLEQVESEAKDKGILLHRDSLIGFGIGTEEIESPFIEDKEGSLEENMVIALSIVTLGPKSEKLCSQDIYRITKDGCERLSDYKDWDEIYEIYGFRVAH
ncbi:MAG: M24 family metallopeptidase [Thermotogota bacterium]|nr:M24 family metallopeptidase [Thermotogota bacterium]